MLRFIVTQYYGINKHEKELSAMPINIQQYVVAGRLDVLQRYCESCLYKLFDERILVSECGQCGIQAGIEKILNSHTQQHRCGSTGNS